MIGNVSVLVRISAKHAPIRTLQAARAERLDVGAIGIKGLGEKEKETVAGGKRLPKCTARFRFPRA